MQTILIGAFCSLAGGVVGAVVGAYTVHRLTRSREHQVFVRDSRIKEWQELLDTLTRAYTVLLSHPPGMRYPPGILGDKKDVLADVDIVLSTRIFIAEDVGEIDIRMRWSLMVSAYRGGVNKQDFKNKFQDLRRRIVESARQTI